MVGLSESPASFPNPSERSIFCHPSVLNGKETPVPLLHFTPLDQLHGDYTVGKFEFPLFHLPYPEICVPLVEQESCRQLFLIEKF